MLGDEWDEYRNLNTLDNFPQGADKWPDALGKIGKSGYLRNKALALTSFSPWLWTDHPEPSELEISQPEKMVMTGSPHPALHGAGCGGR